MARAPYTIRQTGTHGGKTVVFGFDRYLLPELDAYVDELQCHGSLDLVGDIDDLHYLTSAKLVCERVQQNTGEVGVLVCGTGIGMSIAANKFRGIYASRCTTAEDGRLSRMINNANVLCLSCATGLDGNRAIIQAFMTTPYEGRKLEQLEYITQFELESEPAPPADTRGFRVLRRTA